MPEVKPVDRTTIDAWPIARAGLPRRVVMALCRANVQTVGQLRARSQRQVQQLCGVGTGAVREGQRFFALCARLEEEPLPFATLEDVFRRFLKPAQARVIEKRYGLRDEGASLKIARSLESIGEDMNLTRERVRQVESRARECLAACLPQACLRVIYVAYEEILREAYGIVTDTILAGLEKPAFLGNYNPCGVLLLLCDCGGSMKHCDGFVTTIDPNEIKTLQAGCLECFLAAASPLTPARVVNTLDNVGLPGTHAGRHVVACILEHLPGICVTSDGRYFMPAIGSAAVIHDIMKKLPTPTHFRAILREYNSRMAPGSRKGRRHILETLCDRSRFTRTSSGYYKLNAPGRKP